MSSTAFQPRAPEEKALVTIDRVEQRSVTKKDGSGTFTMFDIFVLEQQQPFTTTKKDIAESAFSLVGQVAEMSYNVKVNGTFTNYWANVVLPGPVNPALRAQLAAQAQPFLQAAVPEPAPAPAMLQPAPPPAVEISQPQANALVASGQAQYLAPSAIPQAQVSDWEKQKQASIHRQTAAKVAAVLHQAAPDTAAVFWENVQKLALYFDEGEAPRVLTLDDDPGDIPF